MSFAISTRAELLKTKRSASFWLTIIGAGLIPAIFFLAYSIKPDGAITSLQKPGINPWDAHFGQGWESVSVFLFPMYVILICSLLPQIEYKNNTWKQVFASPQTLGNIFFSKFLTIHLLILFCFFLFNAFMILVAVSINLLNSRFPFFSNEIDWEWLLRLNFKTYVSILGISAIQYWLSLRFKGFIGPIGIGLAMLITSIAANPWEHIYKIPYAAPMQTMMWFNFPNRPLLENHELNSIGYFVVFLAIAFFDMKYRKERG